MSDKTSPAAQLPQPQQNRRKRRWLIVIVLAVVIAGSVWRVLFFKLWDSDEFKPPPSWNGTPAFLVTAIAKSDPPPNAGPLDRLVFALRDFQRRHSGKNPGTYTFPARSNALHGISALLTPCMEITGTKYLIAREAYYVEFGHTNLNGPQWVSAVEALLQSAQVQCHHPASNGFWRERLLLIREEAGVVKVIPPSRLADYQKAGLVGTSYKPEAITNSPVSVP